MHTMMAQHGGGDCTEPNIGLAEPECAARTCDPPDRSGVCVLEQRGGARAAIVEPMQLQRIKHAVAAAYVVAVVAIALIVGVSSIAVWVAVIAAALLPAGALLTLWKDPTETMSESIHAARR